MLNDRSTSYMESNYDPMFPDHPVPDQYLSTWANFCTFGDKPAFRWVDDQCNQTDCITYRELNAAASRIATHLRATASLSKGDRVLVIYPPGLDFIKVLFGCQRAGVVMVPTYPPDPATLTAATAAHLSRTCADTAPRAILSPRHYSVLLQRAIPAAVSLPADLPWIDAVADSRDARPPPAPASRGCCGPADPFLVQYTSGATSAPKPVVLSAGAAAHNARCARRAYAMGPDTVTASWLPLYHDCGLVFVLLTVACGASAVLAAPMAFARRPLLWLDMVSRFRADCTVVPAFALPLTVARWQRERERDRERLRLRLGGLRRLILVNEPVVRAEVAAFVEAFRECGVRWDAVAPSYGLAENCTFVCTAWAEQEAAEAGVEAGVRAELLPVDENGVMPVGRVRRRQRMTEEEDGDADMDVRVVRPAMATASSGTSAECCGWQEAPEGGEGEIWVRSPSAGTGYLGRHRAGLTARTFHARLAPHCPPLTGDHSPDDTGHQHQHAHCFLRTGDLGRVVAGFLYVTGRAADALLLNGVPVHPHHLERTVFRAVAGLRAGCCVVFSGRRFAGGAAGADASAEQGDEADDEEGPEVVLVAEVVDAAAATATAAAAMAREVLRARHGVESATVVLVRPRAVPKTTSGKLRRAETCRRYWAAQLGPFLHCVTFRSHHSRL